MRVWISVGGHPTRLRFESEDAYSSFHDEVSVGVSRLRPVALVNGSRAYVRPSSIDMMCKDGDRVGR